MSDPAATVTVIHSTGLVRYGARPLRELCPCGSTKITWLIKGIADICESCDRTVQTGGAHMSGQVAMAQVARKIFKAEMRGSSDIKNPRGIRSFHG